MQKHVEILHILLSVSIFACGDVFQDTWLGFKPRITSLWRQMRTTRIFEVKTEILSKNQGSAYKMVDVARFWCKNTWKSYIFTFLLVFSLAETFSRTHGLDLNPESCPCDVRCGRPGFSKWNPGFHADVTKSTAPGPYFALLAYVQEKIPMRINEIYCYLLLSKGAPRSYLSNKTIIRALRNL